MNQILHYPPLQIVAAEVLVGFEYFSEIDIYPKVMLPMMMIYH